MSSSDNNTEQQHQQQPTSVVTAQMQLKTLEESRERLQLELQVSLLNYMKQQHQHFSPNQTKQTT
jgi:hypothetical protein